MMNLILGLSLDGAVGAAAPPTRFHLIAKDPDGQIYAVTFGFDGSGEYFPTFKA